MAIALASKPNVTPPGGDYPYGNIKDDSGIGDGTPLNTLVHADFHQFFARLLAIGGVTANGLPENNANTFQYVLALQNIINAGIDAIFPAGVILMWSGTTAPAGWHLCDGTSGSPDLKGKFIVGLDPSDPDYDNISDNGGSKTVTLGIGEIPSHSHAITPGINTGTVVVNSGASSTVPTSLSSSSTDSIGGGGAHENRPPYYTLAFIIKL